MARVVLLTGATGFIGSHLHEVLLREGFAVRTLHRADHPELDFAAGAGAATWLPHLLDVEVVINAAGIFVENGDQTFRNIHSAGPRALFEACTRAGVRHVIQISALGAETGFTEYFRSKHEADQFLAQQPLSWTIVQPGLVFAPHGRSARFFAMLASLPLVVLPASGGNQIQPVHLHDMAAGIVEILRREIAFRRLIFVGPERITVRDFLASLRNQLGFGRLRSLDLPAPLTDLAAALGSWLSHPFINRDALKMLRAGSTGNPAILQLLLLRRPIPIGNYYLAEQSRAAAAAAIMEWGRPMLRVSIAVVWLWSGLTSLFFYPREASHELLAQAGLPPPAYSILLLAGGVTDVLLGMAALCCHRWKWIWVLQMAVVLTYTLVLSIQVPELWLHPFGPVLKNLPILAVLVLLHSFGRR